MKNLNEIYSNGPDVLIESIKINSKQVSKGDLFVCIKGVNADRHDYIDEAIDNGAAALIVSKEDDYKIPYVLVDDTNKELGIISKKFYNEPCSKLKMIGATGTDGKTTTTSIIRNMLGNNNCGYIGTNGVFNKDKKIVTNNTTSEINETYKYLNSFVESKLEYASMEISSEALLHNRTNTLELDVAIITNITEDHLNVHKTLENYIECKKKIFSLLKNDGVAIINIDDSHYDEIVSGIDKEILTFGKNNKANLQIVDIKPYITGTIFKFKYKQKEYKVISPLIGEYNVYNLSCALLTLVSLGKTMEEAINCVTNIENVEGRGEMLEFGQDYTIILDYAHTANALKNVLTYLNSIKKGRIITITGSAGGREKEKRKIMGKVVLDKSDFVIFTMDDPRKESVDDIIDDLVSISNKTNYIRINDRSKAIKYGLEECKKNDILLIAGKGRDNYMAIGDKKIPYCDYEVVKNYFK
ncbi:MAG: UDP-N-acetylmuramoyl-L-alanyl-D-glutamate--2,6-diaminopimelate ligase [bacterium]|nr:UDP-N-acetylmuramoyl-L-alanyl-D-glutamate--2,6-diaminopimelate ligase [bacterium]